jgi:hypothetical protein
MNGSWHRTRDFETSIARIGERAELVDGEDVLHAVGELVGDISGVLSEGFGRVARLPATLVLQRLRQVPMVQRGERLDAGSLQLIDETVVEIDALRIGLAGSLRKNAGPGDGEPVGFRADVLHQRDVFLVTVIVVVGDIAGVAVSDVAGRVRVSVPDRLALAVLVPRAFDLVSRGGGAPIETVGERSRGTRRGSWLGGVRLRRCMATEC